MVIIELAYLIGALQSAGDGEPNRAFANTSVATHWDYLRWFLGIHYKFNRRKDTAFWRDCREMVDVSGLDALLDRFRTIGPWDEEANRRYATGDPSFSFEGIMILLLGQHVPTPRPTRTILAKPAWDARANEVKALVQRAFGQAEALRLLRERPDLLQEIVASDDSWINLGGEVIEGASPRGGMVHPQSDRPKRRPYNRLFDAVAARRN
jgi:tryptophan halogenase